MEIKSVKVTRTFFYGPTEYLQWCGEEGIEATQEGFIEFIKDWIYEDMMSVCEWEELEVEEHE